MIVSDIVCDYTRSSGDRGKDPPVLIPNTEVKLPIVENTWLATAREDRTLLDYQIEDRKVFFFCNYISGSCRRAARRDICQQLMLIQTVVPQCIVERCTLAALKFNSLNFNIT